MKKEENLEKEENAITFREFNSIARRSRTQAEKFTTIDLSDVKTLYNLESDK